MSLRPLCLLTLILLGCQAAPPPETLVPVRGKVTVKGKPLSQGTIVFRPDRDRGNTSKHEPRATISPEGTYELESGDELGAPPGWYRVTVNAMKMEGSTKPPVWLVAQKYSDVKTSGLAAEVKTDASGTSVDFDVSPP